MGIVNPGNRRPRRIIAWIINVSIAIWFGYILVSRWNAEPQDSSAIRIFGMTPARSIDPAVDRTQTLIAAINAIPPMPPIVLPPPPEGMQWGPVNAAGGTIDPSDILCGEWTPETRPNLQSVINYLESPATETALNNLAGIKPGDIQIAMATYSAIRQATKCLVARARLNYAKRGNISAALDDLEAVFRISAMGNNTNDLTHLLTTIACQAMTLAELRRIVHECSIEPADAQRAIAMIERWTRDKQSEWRHVVRIQCDELEQILNHAYTLDEDGNGWLVLNRLDDVTSCAWASEPRSGAWNALSVLYNDRKTVTAKIQRFRKAREAATNLSLVDAQPILARVQNSTLEFSISDGPLAKAKLNTHSAYLFRMITRQATVREATIATVALSAYRHDHGVYPESLSELLGEHTDCLPMDLFVDQPLRYKRLDDGDDFLLYSLGDDGVDDDGVDVRVKRGVDSSDRKGDVVFSHARSKPYWEPELQKVSK